jgi:hypothetical protein
MTLNATKTWYPTMKRVALAVAVVLSATCGGGTGDVTPPNPPPPPPPPATSVTVGPTAPSIEATKSVQLTGTARDANGNPTGQTLSWSSSDAGIASVDASGKVTGVAMGTATITAAAGSVTGSTSVTITRQLFDHVFIVVLENRDYGQVVGHASMPYFNNLLAQYAFVDGFYANQHPSVGNYLMMTTGDTITDNGSFNGTITQDNVIRQLLAAGKTWKSYAENLPSTGYVGGDQGLYARRHNPVVWFTDVKDVPAQRQNIVDYSELAADLAANRLPHYVWIEPNLCNDGHDCANDVVNTWLSQNLPPILNHPSFANSLFILTYDESETSAMHGGGKIPVIMISPRAKPGYRSTTFYQFESVLRLSLEALGITSIPGRGNGAPTMWEFFTR